MTCKCEHWQVCDECRPVRFPKTEGKDMTKELLQQALEALIESRDDVDLCYAGVKAARLSFRQERQLGFYEAQLVKHDAAIEALKQALAQQEQPASVDAYVGAREDAAIWKKRALEAEELNRKFIAEVNGPTYLGEPAQQAQPAQGKCKCGHVGTSITVVESFPVHSVSVDEEDPDYKEHYHGLDVDATLQIGLEICRNCKTINGFWIEDTGGAEFYADWGKPRYTHPAPTQPAQEPVGFTSEESIRALKESGVSVQVYASRGTWFDEPLYTRPAPAMPTHEAIYETIINWDEGGKRSRRELARRIEALYTHSVPTQPALSDDEILNCFYASKSEGMAAYMLAVGRAIEAHCRGGAK